MGEESLTRPADRLLCLAAEHPLGGAVEEEDAACIIDRDDRVHGAVDDALEPRLALLEPCLELLKREVGTHAGEHLFLLERLGDVVDRSELKPLHLLDGVGQRGHEDDRDIPSLRTLLEPLAGGEPVQVGHEHVEEDQIGLDILELLQGALPILGDRDLETAGAQEVGQHREIGGRVVHHHDQRWPTEVHEVSLKLSSQ